MKKLFVMVLVIVTVMAFYSMAFATTFTRSAQCVNETTYVSSVNGTSGAQGKAVRMQYNAQGCSNSYTNHFKVMSSNGARQFGSKFVLPVQEYPLTCDVALDNGGAYHLDMRGNTRYALKV
ncbi:MAG: hypothetical protein RSC05_12280 [Acinetobacter sp.]